MDLLGAFVIMSFMLVTLGSWNWLLTTFPPKSRDYQLDREEEQE